MNDSGVGSESDDLHQSSPTPNGASTHINDVGATRGGGEETSHHAYDRLREAPPPLEAKSDDDDAGEANGYTFWQIARTSLIFCPVWFAANYSYNKSLSLTSVSSNTILSSTSSRAPLFPHSRLLVCRGGVANPSLSCVCVLAVCAWPTTGLGTLFLGSVLGVDSFSFGKLIAVGLSLGGVAMVALTDSNSSDGDSLAGDILCLIGAPSPNPPITATTVMGPPSSLRRALPPSNVTLLHHR